MVPISSVEQIESTHEAFEAGAAILGLRAVTEVSDHRRRHFNSACVDLKSKEVPPSTNLHSFENSFASVLLTKV